MQVQKMNFQSIWLQKIGEKDPITLEDISLQATLINLPVEMTNLSAL
jgi:hypothetical protein